MSLMPIERIPDWEQRLARQDAFWRGEIIDRPVAHITFHQPNPDFPYPPSHHTTISERWMDTQYVAECVLARVMNIAYMGDALPQAWPNLGPEIFSAFFGCELEYSESTSWAIPNLKAWNEVEKIKFREDNFYWQKILEMTDAFLHIGKGKFYTGLTDFHPNGDALAAFRDPLNLNMDLLDAPEKVKALTDYITKTFLDMLDFFFAKFTAAGQAIANWPGIVSTKQWGVPQCDFSCMISTPMFEEFFLPAIREECRRYEASLYHLDGPNALRHLDALLAIEELTAIQWVAGAGQGRASDWLPVYKKCQAAGKGLQIFLDADESDLFMQELKPAGLWLNLSGISKAEDGEAVLKKLAKWK